MDKLKLQSPDVTTQNIEKLKAIFPTCVSETKNDQGELIQAIDFDLLKQELSKVIVEGPQERYRLDWPGKREALLTANAPIAKTLRPVREESVNFDSTENLFIEGDNLDALKLLQETYLNKVKMIYIDPPYNTGNDFIYKDDFAEDRQAYLVKSNQHSEGGEKLVANPESNGSFHSDWLSMIYPRLKLARNLLSDDGVIFISIDDNEQANLKRVCDEIFGEKNFVASIVWEKVHTRKNSAKYFSVSHEYILAYARNLVNWNRILLPRENTDSYKNPDNHPKGPWKLDPITAHNPYDANYSITKPNGVVLFRPSGSYWRFSEQSIQEKIANSEVVWGEGESYPMIKRFLSEVQDGLVPVTLFTRKFAGDTSYSKKEIDSILSDKGIFEYTKPTLLIKRLMQLSTKNNDIVLDFFAGSGTTAHAVMQLNAVDGGTRQCISVQLPEVTDEKSDAYKAGYKTIAEISKERIRRAGQKIKQENPESDVDIGFRVLKIDSSNMVDTYYSADATIQKDLLGNVDNIKEDRSSEDLLFQVLLSWGVDLTLPIEKLNLAGKEVYCVDGNALLACFDDNIDDEWVKHLAHRHPLRVVFKDTGFANDAAKINVGEVFKLLSPKTEVKAI